MSEALRGKRLLVLGGTRISCEIIRRAKEMGLTVAVADYYPVEKAPGKQIADENYDVSVTDVDAVVCLIRERGFDGVITGFSDMLLPYYAEICEKAGLPSYGTVEQFRTFTDKSTYKALCRRFGVPTVEEYAIDAHGFDFESIQYPILVKPADSSGSRGVSVCNSISELQEAIQQARNFSKEGRVLVERYLTGREVTVFWLFSDGEYYLTAIANRHVKRNQGDDVIPLPVGYTYPASVTPDYRAHIEENAKAMFRGVGIKNGMMFMQCKVENGTCVVYDIGYRLTGTLEYINFRQVAGYDPLEMLIRFSVTGKMCANDELRKIDPMGMKPAYNVSLLACPGTIKKIDGIEEARARAGVADVIVEHYPGETITESMRGLLAQISVRVFGTVERKERLYQAMSGIEDTIHIISTEGTLMNLPGIEEKDIEGFVL